MELLLASGAVMEKDSYGMSPLMAAAVTGHTRIVEFLVSRPVCTVDEKIDALELLGATYVDKKRDMLGALHYWKQAMKDKCVDSTDTGVSKSKNERSAIAAYENAKEVSTMDELYALIADPDDMRMQALLVRERILGPAHPDTSYYIRYRGAVYADLGNFDRCITLWMYALEMQLQTMEPLSAITQSSFLSFAELFSFMMADGRSHSSLMIAFPDMMAVFEKAVKELETGMIYLKQLKQECDETDFQKDDGNFNRLMIVIMHLISSIVRSMDKMTEDQKSTLKQMTYRLVRLSPVGSKKLSLLHMACSKDTSTVGRYPVCTFPDLSVVELLLEVGASTNLSDTDGNTPLHIAANNKPNKYGLLVKLLESGAHIDAANNDDKTAGDLLSGVDINDIVNSLEYTSLQCLAAREIRKAKIPYKGHIPKKLEVFVSIH